MTKKKKKLSPEQKAAKKRRREQFETVFVGGKQKRVRRPPMIDGIDVDEFIRRNADPIFLLQNGMYEELHEWEREQNRAEPHHPDVAEDIFRDPDEEPELPL